MSSQNTTTAITVVAVDQAPRITLVQAGQGLQGPPGPAGTGGAGGAPYVHTQTAPAATWIINHNRGARPNISVTSMGGVEYLVEVIHPTVNQAVVYFEAPAAGLATCS